MKSFMSICLDKTRKIPIYKQLGDALLKLIDEGILPPETKLPPIRKMAKCLKINNTTVVNTYKYLESKNAVYSTHGSGIYVSPVKPNNDESINYEKTLFYLASTDVTSDFTAGFKPNFDSRQLSGAVRERLVGDGVYKGNDNLLITVSNNVFDIVAKATVSKNDYVIVEKPVCFSRVRPYLECGANILPVPVIADGIDLSVLESLLKIYNPKVFHICTYFQTPTDKCCSLENKKNITKLCAQHKALIVEEDNFSELTKGKRILLKSLDHINNVIYVKNLTKLSFPSYCMYACLLPKSIAERSDYIRCLVTCQNDLIVYEKLQKLFVSNSFTNETNKIVNNYNFIYDKISQKLDDIIGSFVEYDKEITGAGFWIKLKHGDSAKLADYCAKKGVLIIPGTVYYGCDDTHYFRMCFENLNADYLDKGILIIRDGISAMK